MGTASEKHKEVKAASGKGFNLHKFSIRNSGALINLVVRKLRVQRKGGEYSIKRDWI